LEKEVQIDSYKNKYLSFGANIFKIGPVDPGIIGLRVIIKIRKKREINASKTYSPPGKFAEQANKTDDDPIK